MPSSGSSAATARRLIEPTYWTCPHGARQRPVKSETFGPEVADLAAGAGLEPDPQQELGLDLLFAVNPDGSPVTFEFCVICARQNLKSSLFVMAVIGWTYVLEVPEVMWTAHLAETANDGMRAVEKALLTSPALRRRLPAQKNDGFYDDPSNVRAELTTGQKIRFRTRTPDGARGLADVHKLIIDEALKLTKRQAGAMYPTLAAKPNGQVAAGSSAGPLEAEVLREIRDRGRAGFSSRMTYLEWLARREPCRDQRGEVDLGCRHPKNAVELGVDCALDREHLIREANPTLSMPERMTISVQRGLRQSMPTEEYMRECFGWWEDPKLDATSVFGPGRWAACQPKVGGAFPQLPTSLGVAVAEDRSWSSIAAASIVDVPVGEGRDEYVQVPFVGAVDRREGVTWLPTELARIQDATDCVIHLLNRSASSNLVDTIEDEDAAVEETTADMFADWCSDLYDAVRDRRLVQMGTTELDEAVAAAEWRSSGRRRVFVARDPSTPIDMLEAAVLAVGGAGQGAFEIR